MNVSTPVRRCLSARAYPQSQSVTIRRRFIALLTAGLCGLTGAGELLAATYSYDRGPSATGADWGVAENWSSDTVPGALDNAWFSIGTTITLTVNLGANREVAQLYFNQSNANWTIGSAADVLAGNTLTVASVKRDTSSGATQFVRSNMILSATNSIWDINAGFNGGLTIAGNISGSGKSIEKWGNGLLTLAGANTFDGGLSVNSGTIGLDFIQSTAPTSNIVASTNSLTIGGGGLTATGKGGAAVSQTFAGTSLISGNSSFSIVNGNTANTRTLINLGALTRVRGATLSFTQPTGTNNSTVSANNGFTTTTQNDVTGILGAHATVGTEWAANDGTNIVAYTGYADLVGASPNLSSAPTSNVRITSGSTGDVGQDSAVTTVNTIRVNDAAARVVTVGAGNTLRLGAVGGILATGTNGLTIGAVGNAGTLTAGSADNAAGELFLNNSTAVTINSVIANNGTGAVSFTKSGSGTATLTTAATHTGGTIINGGTVTLAAGADRLATTGDIVVNGGTLNLGTSTQNLSANLIVNGGTLSGGSVVKTGADYDARSGTISAALGGSVGLTKTTAGTVTLSSANTYTGITTVLEGRLSASAAGSTKGNIIVGSINGGNEALFVGGSSSSVADSANATVYKNGSFTLGNGDHMSSVTVIGGRFSSSSGYVDGSITMTGGTVSGNIYGNQVNLTTNASTETATVDGGLLGGAGTRTFNVANGQASIDLLVSGGLVANNTLVKSGDGLMAIVGAKTFLAATSVNAGTLSIDTLGNGTVASTAISTTAEIGATTLKVDSVAGLAVGQTIYGGSIPTGTTITAIDVGTKTITLSDTVTARILGGSVRNFGELDVVTGSLGYGIIGASGLVLKNGSTFAYTGTGQSTNRLFTIGDTGTGQSATVEASGTGAANFTNTGSVAWGTTGQTRTLNLGGSNTGSNTLAALIANNGSGVVSLTKLGAGKWVLSNANTYTGATTVSDGRLALDATGSIATTSALNIGATGVFDVSAKSSYALGTGGVKIAIGSGSAGFFDAGSAAVTLGNALTLDFTGSIVAGSYNLFDFGSHTGDFSGVNVTGSIVGSLISGGADIWNGNIGGYSLSFSEATGLLSVSAVPEPSTYALFGGVLILGYVVCRRSRHQGA